MGLAARNRARLPALSSRTAEYRPAWAAGHPEPCARGRWSASRAYTQQELLPLGCMAELLLLASHQLLPAV